MPWSAGRPATTTGTNAFVYVTEALEIRSNSEASHLHELLRFVTFCSKRIPNRPELSFCEFFFIERQKYLILKIHKVIRELGVESTSTFFFSPKKSM